MLQLTYAIRTDAGRIRSNNEDNFYWNGLYRRDVNCPSCELDGTAQDTEALAAVCDGMGGEACGEIASLLAVQRLRPCAFDAVRATAAATVREANDDICRETRSQGRRMGSTLTALYLDGGKAMTCNVGDSRVYLFRDGELRQLTTDHCKSQRLIAMGVLTEEQARKHPSKHELTQHLGIFEEEMIIEPEFGEALTLQPGDVFLLCSDGLTDMVEDRDIAALLGSNETPSAQADALLHTALENGGRDNVTILVLRVDRKPLLQRVLNGLRKQEGQA